MRIALFLTWERSGGCNVAVDVPEDFMEWPKRLQIEYLNNKGHSDTPADDILGDAELSDVQLGDDSVLEDDDEQN